MMALFLLLSLLFFTDNDAAGFVVIVHFHIGRKAPIGGF